MQEKRQVSTLEVVAVVLIILIVVVGSIYTIAINPVTPQQNTAETKVFKAGAEDPLSYWTEEAETKKQLLAYMEAITDPNSPDFIPVERRIATFDLDGTLFGETNPIYFDHSLLLYRVLQDPDYIDKASDTEKATCYEMLQGIREDTYPEGMDIKHGQGVASAFAGMTVDEFVDYNLEFRKQPAPGYDNLLREDMFYKPMLQIVDFLQAYDFTVYVVSGTDRLILRGICDGKMDVPYSQLKGSCESLVATNQDGADGLEYVFTDTDKLILGGDFIIKNLKMNKVSLIGQEIGVQPVLAFGNSSGDTSMLNYAVFNNEYKSLSFALCCDDLEREYGNLKKAEKMLDLCNQYGWIPVSMKNDWTTIYGEDVKKNPDNGLDFYYEYEIDEALDDVADAS